MRKADELQARMDAIEQRMAESEHTAEVGLQELIDVLQIVLDAVTYLSGAVERLRAELFEERGWRR